MLADPLKMYVLAVGKSSLMNFSKVSPLHRMESDSVAAS